MCHLSSHANAFAQRWVRVDGFPDVDCVGAHFNGQGNLTDHVSSVRADHSTSKDAAMAVCLG